ncbi:claspin [Ditylenchus destructor]|uniref:Claspin n=1 Tax=Ditylenchus destructor TaxID=166010 RepID=A0AAD4MVC9_9BILA|nr:claspin [Ditylenchus destructor]
MEMTCNSPVLDQFNSATPPILHSGSKKPCSAAHRKLQAILESGQLDANSQPKTFAPKSPATGEISLEDDDDGKSSRKRKAENDPLEEWFARKLSSYKGAKHHEEEVMESKKPKVVKYTEMKKELEQKLSNDDNSMDSESESSQDEEEPELGYANKQHPTLPPGESQQIRSISEDFNEALFLCSGTFEDEGDKPRQNVTLRDFLEDEASLSGDDVGSDIEELGSEFDEYEAEEGDNDELPDEEEIRDNLVKQYMKQTNDEEERRLLKMQEHFLYDADLHGRDMDRSFRFRMRDDLNIDWSKILGDLKDEENALSTTDGDDDDAANIALRERKVEYLKWKLEQENKKPKESLDESIGSEIFCSQSSLLSIGQKILSRKKVLTSTADKPKDQPEAAPSQSSDVVSSPSMLNRDSLLKKASMLGSILKEKPSGSNSHTVQRILFTSMKH